MAGYAVLIFGITCLNILIWAFITDVIDHQEIRTGERNDATMYATYSWARGVRDNEATQDTDDRRHNG